MEQKEEDNNDGTTKGPPGLTLATDSRAIAPFKCGRRR